MPNTAINVDLLLNMQMLKDELEEEFNITYALFHSDRQTLRGAQVYYGQKELSADMVYVARCEVFEKYPIASPDICQISVGPLHDHEAPVCCARMEIASAKWEEVFNMVLSVFVRYAAWARRLQHILGSGGGLYELCVAAIDFFQNPLYIHDENFNVLAMPMWVVGMTEMLVDEVTGNTTLPLEKIQSFQVNPDYIKTLSTHGAQMWNPSYNSHRVIYVNIWAGDKYCGRFLINEMNSPLKPSHFAMAEYFAKVLSVAFQQNLFKSSSDTTFEKILYRILCGEKIDEPYLLERLHMVGWERGHRYVCFQLRLQENGHHLLSARKLSSAVGIFLKKSFSFSVGNVVYTICNLTQSGYNSLACEKIMLQLSESVPMVSGASSSFCDFMEIEEYCRQAGTAIEVGRRRDPEKKHFPFHRYVLDYILQHCLTEYSPRAVCSSAILRLDASDREKGTDYIKTLQCYFDNNCQQTATAQAMFIHRSTLTYRLEKMQELTGIDLADPDTRLYLQISIKLLESL